MADRRPSRSSRRLTAVVVCLLAICGGAFAAVVASQIQLGCGSRRLVGQDFTTRLYCVSVLERDGGRFLLLRNAPEFSGDDVTTAEATKAVRAVMPYLRADVRGACFQRRGIDDSPVCVSKDAAAGSASRQLETRSDNRRPYQLLVPLGIVCGALISSVVLALWPRGGSWSAH
jgi:hypothetical protein